MDATHASVTSIFSVPSIEPELTPITNLKNWYSIYVTSSNHQLRRVPGWMVPPNPGA